MKLGKCHLENFASYDSLDFNYADQGLALISGPTGSGKSTLLDGPAWVLFGTTAKGGAVDEVRAWDATAPTVGVLEVDGITVTRIRGSAKENDLYWQEPNSQDKRRGKDLSDTQRLLDERLGVNADLYATAAYFSEFSPATHFFTAKAKDRREVFEKVANLSFPVKLSAKAQDARKAAKADLQTAELALSKAEGALDSLKDQKVRLKRALHNWYTLLKDELARLASRAENFEAEIALEIDQHMAHAEQWEASMAEDSRKINLELQKYTAVAEAKNLVGGPCPTCGHLRSESPAVLKAHREIDALNNKLELMSQLQNPHYAKIQTLKNAENHYQKQLEVKAEEVNPFGTEIEALSDRIDAAAKAIDKAQANIKGAEHKVASLTHLLKLTDSLRGLLLTQAVQDIQKETNRILHTYFNAEIKVEFAVASADNVTVTIQKSGHECSYTQLSKGQRGLLKLAFAVAVMRSASNRAGIHFDTLAYDEALDGLDGELKVGSYGLFSELSLYHSSILVIDHSVELKEAFDKKYNVALVGDYSQIEAE